MYLLPRIVRAFRAENPDIEIILDVDTTDAIVERVALNALDLGFVGGPIVDRRLTVEGVVEDPLALIASPDCPLVRQDRVAVQDLAVYRLIVPEPQSRTRRLVEQHLREAGLTLRPSLQMVGTEAVKKAVEANLGIAFVSSFAVGPEVAHGILCRLEPSDLKIVRQLELIFRSHRYVSPAAKGFRRFLRERAHQLSVE
jgi:DNA-binding transcriptional LysR family regulator